MHGDPCVLSCCIKEIRKANHRNPSIPRNSALALISQRGDPKVCLDCNQQALHLQFHPNNSICSGEA